MKRMSLLMTIAFTLVLCFIVFKAIENVKQPIKGAYYVIQPEIYYE